MGSVQLALENSPHLLPVFEPSDFEERVSPADLATVFKISPRRIFQLAQRGILPASKHGRYPLRTATARYMTFLLEGDGLERRTATSVMGRGRQSVKNDLASVQLERARLRLANERRQVIPLTVFKEVLSRDMNTIRDRLLLLPQVAPQLAGESIDGIRKRLELEVRKVLESLSHAADIPTDVGEGDSVLQTSANLIKE